MAFDPPSIPSPSDIVNDVHDAAEGAADDPGAMAQGVVDAVHDAADGGSPPDVSFGASSESDGGFDPNSGFHDHGSSHLDVTVGDNHLTIDTEGSRSIGPDGFHQQSDDSYDADIGGQHAAGDFDGSVPLPAGGDAPRLGLDADAGHRTSFDPQTGITDQNDGHLDITVGDAHFTADTDTDLTVGPGGLTDHEHDSASAGIGNDQVGIDDDADTTIAPDGTTHHTAETTVTADVGDQHMEHRFDQPTPGPGDLRDTRIEFGAETDVSASTDDGISAHDAEHFDVSHGGDHVGVDLDESSGADTDGTRHSSVDDSVTADIGGHHVEEHYRGTPLLPDGGDGDGPDIPDVPDVPDHVEVGVGAGVQVGPDGGSTHTSGGLDVDDDAPPAGDDVPDVDDRDTPETGDSVLVPGGPSPIPVPVADLPDSTDAPDLPGLDDTGDTGDTGDGGDDGFDLPHIAGLDDPDMDDLPDLADDGVPAVLLDDDSAPPVVVHDQVGDPLDNPSVGFDDGTGDGTNSYDDPTTDQDDNQDDDNVLQSVVDTVEHAIGAVGDAIGNVIGDLFD